MTQAVDPFAQADGTPSIDPSDPFSQPVGGGEYPKIVELFGELLMLRPSGIKKVPDNFNKTGPDVDQLVADTIVLSGQRAGEEYTDMWWNNAPIVKAARHAMNNGSPAILGRLYRYPTNDDVKAGKYKTRHDIEVALANWRPGTPNVRFAWVLENFTPEDREIALAYLASKKPVSPF